MSHGNDIKGKKYLIPLIQVKPFLAYLNIQGHEIDQIDNDTLEIEWLNYCELKRQAGGEEV